MSSGSVTNGSKSVQPAGQAARRRLVRMWQECTLLFLTVPGLPPGLYSSMKMSFLNAGRSEVWLEHNSVHQCAWLSRRSTYSVGERVQSLCTAPTPLTGARGRDSRRLGQALRNPGVWSSVGLNTQRAQIPSWGSAQDFGVE